MNLYFFYSFKAYLTASLSHILVEPTNDMTACEECFIKLLKVR